jgi:hypothetical protein
MYEGPDRRQAVWLTDDQINVIAERAAEKALESVYAQIGKSVVTKVLWLVGAASLAVFAWLKGKGLV